MYTMERVKDIVKKVLFVSLLALLFSSTLTKAMPAKRSSARNFMLNGEPQMHMSDGILRDFMMHTADLNGDNKLSSHEIAWFYRNVVLYTDYVANVYGRSFIDIADMDHDGLLDGDELLEMIVALNATDWTKKRR